MIINHKKQYPVGFTPRTYDMDATITINMLRLQD